MHPVHEPQNGEAFQAGKEGRVEWRGVVYLFEARRDDSNVPSIGAHSISRLDTEWQNCVILDVFRKLCLTGSSSRVSDTRMPMPLFIEVVKFT